MSLLRYLLCLLGMILAIPLLALVVLAIKLPVSISGILYLITSVLVITGLILAPLLPKHYLQITIVGLIGLVLIAGTRLILVGGNTSTEVKMITLPEGKGTRWINTLIDERDSLVFGEQLFHRIGGDSDREHENLSSAFVKVFFDMGKDRNLPSPIISTYLNLQRPDHFDAILIKPAVEEQPKFALVFLHGFMGNVTGQCWVIGQAVKKTGGMTICPSTGWRGEWWQPEGQLILKSTLKYVRDQGIEKIYLGGFSNGGFSTGRLAPELAGEQGLNGLLFIDGFMSGTRIRALNLPVLVIQGTQDERVSVEAARQFAEEVGSQATYREVNSDHFLILKQPEQVQNVIASWLSNNLNR